MNLRLTLAGRFQWTMLLVTSFVLCASLGCVRRRLTVRTQPAGAMVYVDKEPIGKSPISTSFTYYGTREVETVLDGYRTEKIRRQVAPPWYQIPPIDFVAETLWPWEIRDERVIDIQMVPKQVPTREELLARGDQLRLQASQGIAVPVAPVQPIPSVLPPDPQMMGQPIGGGVPALDGPDFRPGRILGEAILPGGQLPQRIPETGGSFRPELGAGEGQ